MALDSYTKPGLTEAEFQELMVRMAKCTCGLVMMKTKFAQHVCEKKQKYSHAFELTESSSSGDDTEIE
jgi:hypothetical protein